MRARLQAQGRAGTDRLLRRRQAWRAGEVCDMQSHSRWARDVGSETSQSPIVGRRLQVGILEIERVLHVLVAEAEGVTEIRLETDRSGGGQALELSSFSRRAHQAPQA